MMLLMCCSICSNTCESECFRTPFLSYATLWSRRITVDVQNEYIYSYVRASIMTSVFLEDKAASISLCLRGDCRSLVWDERKPHFLIQFKLENFGAEILSVAK